MTDRELFQISSVEKRDRYSIVAGAAESADEKLKNFSFVESG